MIVDELFGLALKRGTPAKSYVRKFLKDRYFLAREELTSRELRKSRDFRLVSAVFRELIAVLQDREYATDIAFGREV